MPKPHVPRTLGEFPFQKLDDRRFEDLVRLLAYDFKDWKSLEGFRGGNDDGMDIRGYEKTRNASSDEENDIVSKSPMDGNLWVIQCKCEKSVTPQKVRKIINDGVDPENPPYGFILAAATDLSKKSHDVFREELRKRGVMEFYIWGSGELEMMIYQPKNDHIMFAFFGISLQRKQRTLVSEVRANVLLKNRIRKLHDQKSFQFKVLIRDINDCFYPYKSEYKDFEHNSRWRVFEVTEVLPIGIILDVGNLEGYLDREKNEWDFFPGINRVLIDSGASEEDRYPLDLDLRAKLEKFCQTIPKEKRAIFIAKSILRYDDMLLIDDNGDDEFDCPHIYVDIAALGGKFTRQWEYIGNDGGESLLVGSLKRIKYFPENLDGIVLDKFDDEPDTD